MTPRFRVPGAIANRLEELGVAPAAALCRAGLPVGLLGHDKILMTTEEPSSGSNAIIHPGSRRFTAALSAMLWTEWLDTSA
jgi:hypothetical protein